MTDTYDIAVLGSGFGGSLISMIARRLGLRVLMLERGTHPRFAIGESTSPLTNLILEQLGNTWDLPFLVPFCTYGAWKKTYPEVGVGLKRGFTYYDHRAGQPFVRDCNHSTQLMVAASPRDEIGDTHWLRSDFDEFVMHRAVELGVDYVDSLNITDLSKDEHGMWAVSGSRMGEPFSATAQLLIDATGPRGILHRLLGLQETEFADFPKTQALFSHFTNVHRCDQLAEYAVPGVPPYPADDAALHHCFYGGWTWVLRFENGVTSAGISVTDELAAELGLPGDLEAAWQRYLDRFPSVRVHLGDAVPTLPFVYSSRLSYRAEAAAGDGWVMLPSAAAFLDPLFSTGIPLTLLGIERLGVLLKEHWGKGSLSSALNAYGASTMAELDSSAEFIGASLRSLSVFPVFTAFSQFYFAAASYSEMARRLGKRHLVSRFLAADRADFRSGMTRCITEMNEVLQNPTPEAIAAFERNVAAAIDCINIAGLADPAKQNWYGVELRDLVVNAHKLELTPEEMQEIIETADWV